MGVSSSFLGGRRAARLEALTRPLLTLAFVGLLMFSAYALVIPSQVRCGLPGAVGCPGGFLGPAVLPGAVNEQWFTVTMYDWGFWIADSTSGANETAAWNVFEGWTVHINATSLAPDAAIGGTAYHGLGVEINATGQQLLSLAAPVGQWTQGAFVAPTSEYHHQHIWCTIGCGPGHSGQQMWNLNVIPALPLPSAKATSNVTSGASPLSVAFVGTASLGTPPYNLTWDFGDGTPQAHTLATNHTYTLGGDYAAQFQVTDSKGMSGVATINIVVNSTNPLTATATANPSSGVLPVPVYLRVAAHGGVPPYTFAWTFGDGQSATGSNATRHLYGTPGVYAVVATVHDSAGVSIRALASVTVLPPAGSFPVSASATPTNGSPPFATTLTASPAGGSSPYTYLWVFGDGSTAAGATVNHQYNTTGSYVATVFVQDSAGRVGTGDVVLPVQSSGGGGGGDDVPNSHSAAQGLTLFPLAVPDGGGLPLSVNASASIMGGSGTNESVSWNFGDGTTGTGQIVSHRFTAVGVYNLSVTATDSGGSSGANWTSVSVESLSMTVEVNRTAGDDPFTLGAAVTIQGGTGRYGAVSWAWGDGSSSSGNLANHTYDSSFSGLVTIQASATDSNGAPVSASSTVNVYPALRATITAFLPPSRSAPIDARFLLSITGGSGTYAPAPFWNFGDGGSTRGGSPMLHPYTKVSNFHVVVQTNDSLGTPISANVWVNLSSSAGRGSGGPAPWSLTGVSDPNRVAIILIGIVAASGLILVRRRQTKKGIKAAAQGARSTATPGPARTTTPPGNPPK